MARPLVDVRDLYAAREDTVVVRGLSLKVEPGEVVAMIGPNGAGKTTTLTAISGLASVLGGSIEVLGHDLPPRRRAHEIARWGVRHVPQEAGVFRGLTVRENLELARAPRNGSLDVAIDSFPSLGRLLDRRAGLLSGGEQRMLALGAAFASRPVLLLVDELTMGLAPGVVDKLPALLRSVIEDSHGSAVVVDQHPTTVLQAADRAYVLNQGELVVESNARDLIGDRELLQSLMLGGES